MCVPGPASTGATGSQALLMHLCVRCPSVCLMAAGKCTCWQNPSHQEPSGQQRTLAMCRQLSHLCSLGRCPAEVEQIWPARLQSPCCSKLPGDWAGQGGMEASCPLSLSCGHYDRHILGICVRILGRWPWAVMLCRSLCQGQGNNQDQCVLLSESEVQTWLCCVRLWRLPWASCRRGWQQEEE